MSKSRPSMSVKEWINAEDNAWADELFEAIDGDALRRECHRLGDEELVRLAFVCGALTAIATCRHYERDQNDGGVAER